jgi:phosphonate transport system substrate-binding protein
MRRFFSLLILFLLTACNLPFASPTALTPTLSVFSPVSTLTPAPTPLPDIPLGTQENPVVLSVFPSSGHEIPEAAQDLIAQLSSMTGLVIVPFAPATYTEVVDALSEGRVHIAWLPPFAYLLAHKQGAADAALATLVLGHDRSASQFLVNRRMVEDRTFTLYYDPVTGSNLADAATALGQFKDKKPCWTDPASATGYVVPLGILNQSSIQVKTGAFVRGHATVIRSLYSDPRGEICQFGVTIADHQVFIAAGYEDAGEQVPVAWVSEAVVPFDTVVYGKSLPDELRLSLTAALLSMIQTEEGNAALRDTFQIDGLKMIDDTFYDALRSLLEASGLDLTDLVN